MELYKVIVADAARRQIEEAVLFLRQESPEAAQALRVRLIEALRSLSSFPGRYPFFNEPYIPANRYHKMIVQEYYLILYQIKDQTVFVDYVLDCRRDYRWLLHSL